MIDIVLHCVDHGHLKSRSLFEVFPALNRFNQITHCASSRRIAVGSRTGTIALYELRGSKCQVRSSVLFNVEWILTCFSQFIQAHGNEITACSFSPDGKNLASYSCTENRLSLWQVSEAIFLIIKHQVVNGKRSCFNSANYHRSVRSWLSADTLYQNLLNATRS